MPFEHDQSWDYLETIFNSQLPIKEAWNKIMEFHEKQKPAPYWTTLRQLDVETEQVELKEWLEHVVSTSPIPESVAALWIGIIRLASDEGQEIPAIYITGADTYDKEDIDWTCEPVYVPKDSYTAPSILKEIDDLIKTDSESFPFLDWILPLAYCALTLDEIIRTKLDRKLFLNGRKQLFVTTGHDDGDYLNLSTIS
jgi:hypothetical protein